MAGAFNDYLIYPILDLVRQEIRKSNAQIAQDGDPFQGTPSVSLFREHPEDKDKLTSVRMMYDSGYTMTVFLGFGSTDPSTFPLSITPDHPEWEFYAKWRLTSVVIYALSPEGKTLVTDAISLLYDNEGRLTGTHVDRIR